MMLLDSLRLVFIDRIGSDCDGNIEYNLYYSDTPDEVWAEDFPEQVPSACYIDNLIPNTGTYNAIRRAVSPNNLSLIQDNSCFSFQDCIDGIIALAWIQGKDGNYYSIPYAANINESDSFFKEFAFQLEDIIEVDQDINNDDETYTGQLPTS